MRDGSSPPPKFKEENLFSDGDSRPITRRTYRTKEEADNWGWGEKEEKISDMFEQINNGSFYPERRQRRCREDLDPYDRVVECPASIPVCDEEDNEVSYRQNDAMESSVALPTPTRGDGVVRTTEALDRLTKYEEDDLVEGDKWIVIRVPKRVKREYFLVDYCDGDEVDEFEWLEGPHLQSTVTVEDLLDRRRSMPRRER